MPKKPTRSEAETGPEDYIFSEQIPQQHPIGPTYDSRVGERFSAYEAMFQALGCPSWTGGGFARKKTVPPIRSTYMEDSVTKFAIGGMASRLEGEDTEEEGDLEGKTSK